MSDTSQGPGWWQASDGKWYRREQHPNYMPPPPPPPFTTVAAPPYPGAEQGYQQWRPQQTNGLAVASLVLSLVWLLGVGSLLAVIFGLRARRQIRQSGGYQGGEGLATAGLVIGIIGLLGAALVVGVGALVSQNARNNQIASCRADAESVNTALQAYQAQIGRFPNVPAPWSASTYVNNYAPLTDTGANGLGPWLRVAPSTTHYVVEYDSQGNVWVDGPGRYDASYNPSLDPLNNSHACDVVYY